MRYRTALLGAAAAAFFTTAASADSGDLDFTLDNETGYQIDNVYVSKPSSTVWGPDILGKRHVLANEDSTDITFNDNAKGCHWDLRVMYHDQTTAEWSNLNLCDITKVTLFYDRKNDVTHAVTE